VTNVPPPELSGRGTFFIFVKFKLKDMENFIAAIIVVVSLSVATFQVLRNFKYRELMERRHRLLPVVLYVESLLVICDLAAGGDGLAMRMVVDVMLALIPLMLLSSSLWTVSRSIVPARACVAAMTMMAVYNVLCLLSLAMPVPPCAYRWAVAILTMMLVVLFMTGIWFRLREVKAVLQAGTVWASLAFVVDAVYMVSVMAELFLLMFVDVLWLTCVVAVLLCATTAAYGIRISTDSVFVFYRRHERRIVESMKMSPVEVSGVGPREDDLFKDIYERVLEYFEKEKPFLKGDLTINDIASVAFTNKLYISRAISQYTGRNFCQFVNYHRVMYSVECFRMNPDLKVAELWPMCGFNTIVSYNMAFRLFMGENPSDWCRKEKIRMSRKGK
jgi:AraC-like DNA-binding protein